MPVGLGQHRIPWRVSSLQPLLGDDRRVVCTGDPAFGSQTKLFGMAASCVVSDPNKSQSLPIIARQTKPNVPFDNNL